MDNFLTCLPFTLAEEGGNDDDPHDPGGRTSRGIIQTEYDAYRQSKGEPTQDVWTASDAEIQDIYRTQYWLPFCPHIPIGVDLAYFDQAVNEGPVEAAKLLQRALGVVDDGHIGIITLSALAKYPSETKLIICYSDERRAFYQGLRNSRYLKGWMARTGRIENDALKMAIGANNAQSN